MAGLSMQALADKMNNVISKQAISKYEKGLMKPDGRVIAALSKALDVSVDYFFQLPDFQIQNIEFRKQTRLLIGQQKRIVEMSKVLVERNEELNHLMNLDQVFHFPIRPRTVRSHADIERIVDDLRSAWDLGQRELPNVSGMLENRGVRIFEIDAPAAFSGLSGWADRFPIIVLNQSLNRDLCRKRFTLLHEFAHLVLEFPEENPPRKKEKLCHQFAGTFLIPKSTFMNEFGNRRKGITLEELTRIKESYGISIQAIMARAHALQIITVREYEQFNKWINHHGYRYREPGNYCGMERVQRFDRLIHRAVTEEIITMSRAAGLAGIPLADFRRNFNEI